MEVISESSQKPRKLDKLFYDLCYKVVNDLGLYLYEMEFLRGSSILRIYIMDMNTKTASLEQCAQVDREIDQYIEQQTWMPEEFTLEVSSPGVFRNLKTLNHFQLSLGERVKISIDNKCLDAFIKSNDIQEKKIKRHYDFIGILENTDSSFVSLNEEKLGRVKFSLDWIKKSNLEPVLDYL